MKKKGDKNNDFQEFLSHLEYLGYETEPVDEDPEKNATAVHEKRPDLWVFKRPLGMGVSVTYRMGQNAVTYLCDYLKVLNQLNRKSLVSTFYTDAGEGKANVHICALYNAPYDKKSFSIFMDMFHQDHNDIGKVPEFDFYAEDGLVNVVPETQQVS
ncbi:MAG: hypothetical protein GXX82_06515 [Syntrophorhabdus sp.]|jgi:hypothetical protein|nr:hypothetical protein [Syntrophorhabdus sp.]